MAHVHRARKRSAYIANTPISSLAPASRTARDPLDGRVFGALTVGQRAANRGNKVMYLCTCACGAEYLAEAGALRCGHTTHCGCLTSRNHALAATTHGKTGTRIYRIWKNMMRRCYTVGATQYADYGGRGIKVCSRWHTFENFLADMGDPESSLTLDRKDNALGYSLGNCRWATRKEQSRHKRTTLMVKWRGRTRVFAELCERVGVNYRTAWDRLKNRDYTLQEALYGKH